MKKSQITNMSVDRLKKLLKQGNPRHATEESIEKDIEEGLPKNEDGTISLITYVAWLVKKTNKR